MEANSQSPSEQGLLDLAVELSTSDVTAGNEFAIFVLVKNPFSKPVWVREVNVSLPSELMRVDEGQIQRMMKEAEDKQQKLTQEGKRERIKLQEKIESLQTHISELTKALDSNTGARNGKVSDLISRLELDIETFRNRVQILDMGVSNVRIHGGVIVDNLKIGSQASEVRIYGDDKGADGNPTRVRQIEIYEPWLVYEQQAQARTVKLKSSLPENSGLQPGSTAVYTVILNVKRSLLFTPAKYRLQFYVNYSFEPSQPQQDDPVTSERVFTNTVAHTLSIRPSVFSVLIGSIVGAVIGAVARLLQVQTPPTTQSVIVSLVLCIILGGMAVIFMARKSDTQSFVSVEDFWGGILIGFLVGYTGTSFFESIVGATTPKL
jgi:hypothetical protein